MQHMKEVFETWTSILNRDSAADHQLISAAYLIIFPVSCANATPKSSDTADGRILHNYISHCRGIPSTSAQASCIMQIQLKLISSKNASFALGLLLAFAPIPL